ncbi:hypothetical protein QYF36_005561 [Acer negundo]|nr:hypothetical protein QYF36_005561 [Acer negundo]
MLLYSQAIMHHQLGVLLDQIQAWTWNEIPCFSAADLTCYTNLITYIILVMDFVVVVVVAAAAAVNGILN